MGAVRLGQAWLADTLRGCAKHWFRQPLWRAMARTQRVLQATRYSSAYRLRLASAWRFVAWFLACRGVCWEGRGPTIGAANAALVEIIQYVYDRGRALGEATMLVLACQRKFPRLRRHLGQAWDSITSWKLEEPLGMRTPMPVQIMTAVVPLCLLNGLVSHPERA